MESQYQNKHTDRNKLAWYRRRMGLSQEYVSRLIGYTDRSMLSRFETGRALPSVTTALQLEIVYRVPVAFLFDDLYGRLRNQIRAREVPAEASGQQRLF